MDNSLQIKFGVGTGIVMIIAMLLIQIGGSALPRIVQALPYVVFLAGVVIQAFIFSKSNNHFVSFGNVFGKCFRVVLIVVVIMAVWGPIFSKIFPSIEEKTISAQQEQMIKMRLSDDDIEKSIKSIRDHWTPLVISGVLLWDLLFGVVFALIGAIVVKKKGDNPFMNGSKL